MERGMNMQYRILGMSMIAMFLVNLCSAKEPPQSIRAVYLNPNSFGEKKVTAAIENARKNELTAVVLHIKDPFGYVYWQSKNPIATEIGAVKGKGALEKALTRFHEAGLWTIAKMDVFQDTQLAKMKPAMAVLDSTTGKPWLNKDKLGWVNPYDTAVWDYVLALVDEAAALGFDEIQFDYVRFPSDGKLSNVTYPNVQQGKEKTAVIGALLARTHEQLQKKGVLFSVDLFGMVAWKKDDFGVGQRIEDIAQNVDAICPMLYPSHFPKRFLGKENDTDFPRVIMERSLVKYAARTKTPVRPWVQAYGYKPETINAQLDGIEKAGISNCFFWNPASDYTRAYDALSERIARKLKSKPDAQGKHDNAK